MVLDGEVGLLANLPALLEVEVHVRTLFVLCCLVGGRIVPPEPSVVFGVVAPVTVL